MKWQIATVERADQSDRRAGVHVQTIYLAYGTKAELLRAAASWKVSEGEDPAIPPPERRWVRELIAEDGPREKFRL